MRFLPVLALLAAAGSAQADPNDARLLWGPSGRQLGKGEGYLASQAVFLAGLNYGVTDHFSLSAGSTVPVPLAYFASAQAGWEPAEWASVSAGMFVGRFQYFDQPGEVLKLPFVATSLGSRRASLSVAAGVLDYGEATTPVAMLGGTAVVTDGVAIVAEAWLSRDGRRSEVPFAAAAVRLSDRRLTTDLGLLVRLAGYDGPPIPWVAFGYTFGPKPPAAAAPQAPSLSRK